MPYTSIKMIALAFATIATPMAAGAQGGPVANACKDDIAKYCVGKKHGQGEVRVCLEANRDKVTAACKTTLDTTGPGKGPVGNN